MRAFWSHLGGYGSGTSFVQGLIPAITVGAVIVAVGAVAALVIPGRLALRTVETVEATQTGRVAAGEGFAA